VASIPSNFNGARICLPLIGLLLIGGLQTADAEFVDEFGDGQMIHDPAGRSGWFWLTGDGDAAMTFSQAAGIGRIEVDARADRRNIWWAFVRHSVSAAVDAEELAQPDRELRIEAKVRSSVAPRRINLHVNHSRTTDFHSHLMEFDLPDSTNWHTISMTTRHFDARPDDEVFVQMALMDWGRETYSLEVDYLKVTVVDPLQSGPDLGSPLPYRPSIPPIESYGFAVATAEDAIVDSEWPTVNLDGWENTSEQDGRPLVAVGATQMALLRWDMSAHRKRTPAGWGVLELTTDQVFRADTSLEEFGELRVVEILDGDPSWTRESVTYENLLDGKATGAVFNGQMLVDVMPAGERGGKTHIAVSPAVLERLLSGRTRGIAIFAQGAIYASFYSGSSPQRADGPKLYFNLN